MSEPSENKSEIRDPKSETLNPNSSKPNGNMGTSPKRNPVQEFESLWGKGVPNVREFLQKTADLTPQQVVEVLCIDQWQRWQQGDRIPAETYLEMHPVLASHPEVAFDLIYGEFLLREQSGEEPPYNSFNRRFPQFSELLERQGRLHHAFEDEPPAAAPATKKTGPSRPKTEADELKEPAEWPVVPGYTILAKLGQGGMGQVFKAKQDRLDRLVALKIIRQECVSQDPHALRRFQQEAKAAAALSHPNIIVIYDFNQVEDTYYIAMEYVEGVDLHQLVRDCGPLPVPLACQFARQIALGLQHGYKHGMVHRDIKPSNLLLALPTMDVGVSGFKTLPAPVHRRRISTSDSTAGSSLSLRVPMEHLKDGVIKILDMGMALLVHRPGDPDSPRWTLKGTIMGTPDFLAPEQAVDSRQVDIRADLYSLGCTLYFLLTARPPFGEFPLIKKLMMHQIAKPRPILELQPDIPRELEQVINKLMAKLPEGRFQTPQEVADALATFAVSDPILAPLRASPPGQPKAERSEGLGAKDENKRPETEAKNETRATPAAPHTAPLAPRPPLKPQEAQYKWTGRSDGDSASVREAKAVVLLKGHTAWVTALAFSQDRRTLASGAVHGSVRLWDLSGSKPCEKAILPSDPGEVHALAFDNGNRILATGCGSLEGLIWLWDLGGLTPKKMATLQGHKGPVETMTFSRDNHFLASGGCDKAVILWELDGPNSKEVATFKGHTENVKAVAFSSDGKTLVSASLDGTIRFWRRGGVWSKDQLAMIQGEGGPIYTIAFSSDSRYMAIGSLDQTVRIFDMNSPQLRQKAVLKGHLGVVRQVQFSPDSRTLVSVCDGGRVIAWNVTSGTMSHELQLPKGRMCSVAFTLDGRYMAAGASDGLVKIFRIYERAEERSDD
jgi:serine/threonine-protein kinase